jgi:head-tail adaptor
MPVFYINPGELRTPIRIQKSVTSGSGVNKTSKPVDIISPTDANPLCYILSKWLGLKGSETWVSESNQVVGFAMATVRYNANISEECQIVKDGVTYQITNVDVPTQRKQWLQITVKSAVNG